MTVDNHAVVTAELTARWPENRVAPSLGRIRALCELLGNPEQSAPVIQITGTNGKGTTAIMIDALLRSLGLRTGRFISPHLVDITERISIDGEPIAADRFDDLWAETKMLVELVDAQEIDGVKMTFFEIMTGMAYAAFADAPVDVMVMEVGMGGTWDATSVATPKVSVITPIDLDHTQILGSTIEEIAHEKAGIIVPGGVGVVMAQRAEAARVIMARAAQVGAPLVREGLEFGVQDRRAAIGGQVVTISGSFGSTGDLFLPLYGEHQARNAAAAVAAVESMLNQPLSADVIQAAFDAVIAPARMELVHSSPAVVLDTAHNPHGVRATLATVEEVFGFNPLIVVIGMMADKAVEEVIELIGEAADEFVVTQVASTARAMTVSELGELVSDIVGENRVREAPNTVRALDLAMQLADEAGPDSGVLVLGSVYLAGEARAALVSKNDTKDDLLG